MADYRKLSELHEWTDNPREASKIDMDNLKWGLEKYGMMTPLLILDDGTVIGGNHRLKVLKELGKTEAWVNVVHPKNEAEKLEIAMLDNQQTANWLTDKLAELINQYKDDIDIQRIKIETKSESLEDILQQFAPEPEEDEFDATPPEEPVSKLGEVYSLGRHRVMCGDSTKIEDVERLMDGKKADMVFTSPPYNLGVSAQLRGNTAISKNKNVYQEYDDGKNEEFWLQLMNDFTGLWLDYAEYLFINVQSLAGNRTALWKWVNRYSDYYCDLAIWDKTNAAPAAAQRVMNSVFEMIFILTKINPNRAIRIAPEFRGTVGNIYRGNPQRNNESAEIHGATFPMDFPVYF